MLLVILSVTLPLLPAFSLWSMLGNPAEYGIVIAALYGLNVLMIYKMLKEDAKRLYPYAIVGGVLSSAALVLGATAASAFPFDSALILIVRVVFMLAFMVPLFFYLLKAGDVLLDRYTSPNPGADFLMTDFSYFLMNAGIVLLFMLPALLANFPGRYYMSELAAAQSWQSEFPEGYSALHMVLLKAFMQLGESFGNIRIGLLVFTVLQMLVVASSVGYLIVHLRKKAVHAAFRIGFLAFVCLVPGNAYMAITMNTYAVSGGLFVLFLIFFMNIQEGGNRWYEYAAMFVTGALCCLLHYSLFWPLLVGGVTVALIREGMKEKLRIFLLVAGISLLFTSADYVVIQLGEVTYEEDAVWGRLGVSFYSDTGTYLTENSPYYDMVFSSKCVQKTEIVPEETILDTSDYAPWYSGLLGFGDSEYLESMPVFGLILRCAVYSLMLLAMILLSQYRQAGLKKYMLVFPLVILLVGTFGHEASYREVYPVMLAMPIMLLCCVGDCAPGRWNRRIVIR